MPYFARPDDTTYFQPGELATTMGWGETGTGLSDVLRQVTMPMLTPETCTAGHNGLTPDLFLCAGYNDNNTRKSVCSGDSGGPLVVRGRQFLVASGGDKLCQS